MAASPSPTVRRKRLGMELRRLREEARLTCEEVGGRLDGMGLAAVRLLAVITRPEYALPVSVVDVSRTDYLCLSLRDQRIDRKSTRLNSSH